MCAPVLIAGAVIGAATSVAGSHAKNKAQKAQQRMERERFDRAVHSENKEAYEKYSALQERHVQETAAASESIKQAGAAASQVRGAVASGAAASGVAGNTVAALIQDVSFAEKNYVAGIVRNRVWSDSQLERQARSIRGDTYQRILGVYPSTPDPNHGNTVLAGLGGAVSGASAASGFAPSGNGYDSGAAPDSTPPPLTYAPVFFGAS